MHRESRINKSLVSRGTETLSGKWSYELLVVLEYIFPFILFIVWPFFPESPYWLIKNGRDEQARKSLIRIHGSKDPEFIDIEIARLKNNVKLSDELAASQQNNGVPYLQLFQLHNLVCALCSQSNPAEAYFDCHASGGGSTTDRFCFYIRMYTTI